MYNLKKVFSAIFFLVLILDYGWTGKRTLIDFEELFSEESEHSKTIMTVNGENTSLAPGNWMIEYYSSEGEKYLLPPGCTIGATKHKGQEFSSREELIGTPLLKAIIQLPSKDSSSYFLIRPPFPIPGYNILQINWFS